MSPQHHRQNINQQKPSSDQSSHKVNSNPNSIRQVNSNYNRFHPTKQSYPLDIESQNGTFSTTSSEISEGVEIDGSLLLRMAPQHHRQNIYQQKPSSDHPSDEFNSNLNNIRQVNFNANKIHTTEQSYPSDGTVSTTISDISQNVEIDASLLLGMERTLYGSLQMSWVVMFLGFNLMMVGVRDNNLPDTIGVVTVVGGIIIAIVCYLLHNTRVNSLHQGKKLSHRTSLTVTFLITAIFVAVVSLELYFAVKHPYLDRAKAVELVAEEIVTEER